MFRNVKVDFARHILGKIAALGFADATDEPVASTSKKSAESRESSRTQCGLKGKKPKGQSGRSGAKKRLTRKDRKGSKDVETPTPSLFATYPAVLSFELIKSCNELVVVCDKLIFEHRNVRTTLLASASRKSENARPCFHLADMYFYITTFLSQLLSTMRNIVGCYLVICFENYEATMLISTINAVTCMIKLLERNFKNLYSLYFLHSLRDDVSAQHDNANERSNEDRQSSQGFKESEFSKKGSEEVEHPAEMSEECEHSKKSEEARHSKKKSEEVGFSEKSMEVGHSKKKSEEVGHSRKESEEVGRSKKSEEVGHSKKTSEEAGHSKESEEYGHSSGRSEEGGQSTHCEETLVERQISAISQQLDRVADQLQVACSKLRHAPEPDDTSSSTCPTDPETEEHREGMKESILKVEMKLTVLGEKILFLTSGMYTLVMKKAQLP
jgi:hypothetical protein